MGFTVLRLKDHLESAVTKGKGQLLNYQNNFNYKLKQKSDALKLYI